MSRCPTSLALTCKIFKKAKLLSFKDCLQMDFHLSQIMVNHKFLIGGEFILATLVEDRANEVASGDPGAWIGSFYGDFYFWVNIGAIGVQALLVSRLVKWTGLAGVLFLLPAISLGTYGLVAFGVGLGVFRWAKTAENLTDYSVMNTAKAMIWLPTSKAEKYKAKAAIDTFVVRIGDVASAAVVYVGLNLLGFGPQQFGMINLAAIAAWLFVAFQVWRHYRSADTEEGAEEAGDDGREAEAAA